MNIVDGTAVLDCVDSGVAVVVTIAVEPDVVCGTDVVSTAVVCEELRAEVVDVIEAVVLTEGAGVDCAAVSVLIVDWTPDVVDI